MCGGAAPATSNIISRYRNRNLTKNKIFLKYFQIYPTISHFCGVGGAKINVLASFFMPFVNFYIKNNQKSLKYRRKLRDFSRNCLKNETTSKILHMSGPGVQRSLAAVHGGAKRRGYGKKLDKN